MSSQPLYRIVYADGERGAPHDLPTVVDYWYAGMEEPPTQRPVEVERVSPAPRATGGQE